MLCEPPGCDAQGPPLPAAATIQPSATTGCIPLPGSYHGPLAMGEHLFAGG
ncbi:MAG TPA: hypothetical protein VIK18_20960 [Pirellulales bacterium]